MLDSNSRSTLVSVAMLCVFLIFASPVHAAGWSEFGTDESKSDGTLSGREVNEPFFDFVLHMASVDSVGEWTGEDLRAYADSLGTESRFPLAEFVTLRRVKPDTLEFSGSAVAGVWGIRLTSAQDRPMPYSIMGYHPGSLRFSQEIELHELAPMDLTLEFKSDGNHQRQDVLDVRIFALSKGHVVLDADGLLDALLGAALDDSWTLGFVVGRDEGRLIAVGVSLGRKDQRIYGEFDLAEDKVLAHGRPVVGALSLATRKWLNVEGGQLPPAWNFEVSEE
ncbi:MAG: hypothetical protein ACI9UQ_002452 [Candidatus Krumholzibacteriia bacterium]|jgi:hypothetical protein